MVPQSKIELCTCNVELQAIREDLLYRRGVGLAEIFKLMLAGIDNYSCCNTHQICGDINFSGLYAYGWYGRTLGDCNKFFVPYVGVGPGCMLSVYDGGFLFNLGLHAGAIFNIRDSFKAVAEFQIAQNLNPIQKNLAGLFMTPRNIEERPLEIKLTAGFVW